MSWLAVLWCLVASIFLALEPLGTTQSMTTEVIGSEGTGASTATVSHTSLLDSEGSGVLIVLAVPALLCLIAIAIASAIRSGLPFGIAAFALLALCVLGAASIGLFFVPAAALMAFAAGRTPQRVTRGVPARGR
jgi:hypothetical protein